MNRHFIEMRKYKLNEMQSEIDQMSSKELDLSLHTTNGYRLDRSRILTVSAKVYLLIRFKISK